MKSYLPLFSLAVVFASCTTSYKSGQTPDDVYFSPARPQAEYVRVDDEDEDDRAYRQEQADREDRYTRMRVRNRRWSTLDDVDYRYSYQPYYNSYSNYNNPWNAYNSWNVLYNPYCCCQPISVSPRATAYSKPRSFNLNAYNGNTPTNTKGSTGYNKGSNNYGTRTSNSNSNSTRSSGAGTVLRNIFNSGNSSSGSNSGSGTEYSGKSSSSGSSGSSSSGSSSSGKSSSGGSAPVRKF